MNNQSWQSSLAQTKRQQGVAAPADPGEMGNIAYAPGAMQMGAKGAPDARQMVPSGPAAAGPPQQQGRPTSPQGAQGVQPRMPPEVAQMFVQRLQEMIRSRNPRPGMNSWAQGGGQYYG